ncbi:MAG: hypothetical protein JKP98_10455 [Rhodobacteraceae bacterium]|jgi:hypothetical protein|nr:hypothetical protein [Paracoccaceae bacterium]MBL4557375.1 hypothetical protein [Paracoccaceae bacterium]
MKLPLFLAIIALTSLFASSALAYCTEPLTFSHAPAPPSTYQKPTVPFCLSGYSFTGRHTCDSWEIDRFIAAVNNYIGNLNKYVNDAIDFANDAAEFAEEAARYARCEAEEARSLLE